MNEEEMKQLREQMEVRIVALLLGEASAFETAEIEQAMQRDADLAAFHAEMRRTIDLTCFPGGQGRTPIFSSAPWVPGGEVATRRFR